MEGIQFYYHLQHVLKANDNISDEALYSFIKWDKNGGLVYNVNNAKKKQHKTIPAEIIVVAKYWMQKGIVINDKWLKENKHNNWCTDHVLNYLLNKY